jgi:hypothetical protein
MNHPAMSYGEELRLENKHQSNNVPLNKPGVEFSEKKIYDPSTTTSWKDPPNHELWGGSMVERSCSSPCYLLSSSLSLFV